MCVCPCASLCVRACVCVCVHIDIQERLVVSQHTHRHICVCVLTDYPRTHMSTHVQLMEARGRDSADGQGVVEREDTWQSQSIVASSVYASAASSQ